MSKRETVSRWNLIIKKLRRHPCKYSEIAQYLADESELQGYDYITTVRTFQRDLEDIRSIYNIDVRYDYSRKVYNIDYEDQMDVTCRILEAFDIFNSLNIADRLSNYLHFEKRRSLGTEHMYGLLHAIKNRIQVTFSYQKYWDDEASARRVEPLALKEHKDRWYVIAKELNDDVIKSFALDRLTNLEISKIRYVAVEFNIEDYFKHCFGIIRPLDEKPEEVLLSFDSHQAKYIKSLPLHESQKIISENENETVIKLNVYLTHDFLMEILSYGETVKILKPQILIDELKSSFAAALKHY